MADKASYCTMLKWIPYLSRYCFTVARKHIPVYGRGVQTSLSNEQEWQYHRQNLTTFWIQLQVHKLFRT